MLDHETTIELIQKAQNGDEKAKETLLINNIQLIKSIVKRYRFNQIEYDDLVQLGSLGLIKAINNFDLSYSVRFSTYAVPMIAGEIKRFLRDDGIIKVPRATKVLSSKINSYIQEILSSTGISPTIEEIAKKFNIDSQDVVFALDSTKYPVSIYEKYDDDSSQCLLDRIESKENTEDLINKITIKDFIAKLPDKEKKVVILRYYRDKTQSEIAKILGVSQVQVSRIEAKVLNKLKDEFLKV